MRMANIRIYLWFFFLPTTCKRQSTDIPLLWPAITITTSFRKIFSDWNKDVCFHGICGFSRLAAGHWVELSPPRIWYESEQQSNRVNQQTEERKKINIECRKAANCDKFRITRMNADVNRPWPSGRTQQHIARIHQTEHAMHAMWGPLRLVWSTSNVFFLLCLTLVCFCFRRCRCCVSSFHLLSHPSTNGRRVRFTFTHPPRTAQE